MEEGALQWHEADTARLQPTNLLIAKPQRAWDRRALSSFARRKSLRANITKVSFAHHRVPIPSRGPIGATAGHMASPMKPVKKLCTESNFGVAPRVSRWEGRGSPMRKIVTRAGAAGQEFMALKEDVDDEEGVEQDVAIEIVEEDGTIREVGVDEAEMDQAWEDEEVFDDTMMHLGTAMDHVIGAENNHPIGHPKVSAQPWGDNIIDEPASPVLPILRQDTESVLTSAPPTQQSLGTDTIAEADLNATEQIKLPEGFVSPVKQRRKLGPRSLKPWTDGRRQTLPVQFAPITIMSRGDECAGGDQCFVGKINDEPLPALSSTQKTNNEHEAEWEDIQEESDPACVNEQISTTGRHDDINKEMDSNASAQSVCSDDEMTQHDSIVAVETSRQPAQTRDATPSSKVYQPNNVSDLDPDSRRASRRKSSSPFKQNTKPSISQSHLVAFTPLKLPEAWLERNNQLVQDNLSELSHGAPQVSSAEPFNDAHDMMNMELPAVIERATSAPPEEAQLSAQKSFKPRLSDDTALLQSFLKRAAESKSSRRLSVSDKESLTNRRDSDTVRRALASTAKLDVLADLDPNSPSVRGQPELINSFTPDWDGVPSIEKAVIHAEEEIGEIAQTTRRSGRGRKKPQVLAPMTYSVPSKISIRANANVDLKKSEAQEKAVLLKTNTRKNKFGALSRTLRLTQLAAENATNQYPEIMEADDLNNPNNATRRLRWAETLAVYSDTPEPESSHLSDEANEANDAVLREATRTEMDIDEDTAPMSAPVAPVDTPSKPKAQLRRLPARNVSAGRVADARSELSLHEATPDEEIAVVETAAKPPSSRKQSRIATPAKALKHGTSLLTVTDDDQLPTPGVRKPAIPRKKAISKMPAPSTSSLMTGNGRENNSSLMLASPAKKKGSTAAMGPSRGPPTVKSFAPKLDFSGSLRLDAPSPELGQASLMSPAKKARGGKSVFASAVPEQSGVGMVESVHGARTQITSSPAKKRTRR
nr:hypothetical protein CFP56_00433 [Quercus suber]